MNAPHLARLLLRTDAAANVGLGITAAAGAGILTRVLVLPSAGVLVPLAALCAVNAVACWRTAADPTPLGLRGLAVVDLGFGGAVLAFVLLDPTGAPTAARWAVGALADVSAAVGLAKLFLAARLARPAPGSFAAKPDVAA